jgi:hypothetical protein
MNNAFFSMWRWRTKQTMVYSTESSKKGQETMSIQPRLEARVSAQERRQLNIDARIEELSEDITSSFKHLSEHLGKIEATMMTKTDLAGMATKEDLAALETRMQGNISALEKRMLDAFQQLVTIIDTRLPPLEK